VSQNLPKKIQENVFRHGLFERGACIVVGCSGGPDSVCLLDILHKLKGKYDLRLIVAHVNYGLRGKDSEKDEKFVNKLSEKYDLPFEKIQITNYKLQITEDHLRNIRYHFFEKIRRKHKANSIAVAHNLNDQAETVLMRILRGTGLRGAGAIRFRNNGVIRPLLNIPRKEILAHLSMNKIPYRVDKTNLGVDFTRNKIRNRLIPEIEKDLNPNAQEALCRLALSAADDHDFIRRFAREWLAKHKSLKVSLLVELHPAILREALRQTIEKTNPHLRDIDFSHIDEILKVLKSTKNKSQIITFKNLKIKRRSDRLNISKG
jgi:tRNA(Ile)-lysidine synthase